MPYNKNKRFLKTPTYPGGSKVLGEFIARHLQYPEEALKNNIQGTVLVHFEVNDNGEVIRTEVANGIGYGCDEEALRIVSLLRYEKVKNIGQRVKTSMKIKIHFNLPYRQPTENKIVYTYTHTNTAANPQQQTYSYTLTLNTPPPDDTESHQ